MILFCEGMGGFREEEGGRKESVDDMSVRLGCCGGHPIRENRQRLFVCSWVGRNNGVIHLIASVAFPASAPPASFVLFARSRFANPLVRV